jgi:hypothetical protein
MLIAAGIAALSGVGLLAFIARELRKAPEGFEDEQGFHVIPGRGLEPRMPSAGVSRAKKRVSGAKVGRPVTRHA